jgi:hypothetical protein
MGMHMLSEDAQLYMSPSEVMSLFDNGLDVQMFSTEYMDSEDQAGHQPQVVDLNMNPSGGGRILGGFNTEPFVKMNSLVTSP